MFTIKTVLDFCKKNPDFLTGIIVTGQGSWRGSYDNPCLYAEATYESDEESKASHILPFLEKLVSGEEFYGYKGGKYVYNEDDILYVESSSRAYSGDSSKWSEWDLEEFRKALEVFEYMQCKKKNL